MRYSHPFKVVQITLPRNCYLSYTLLVFLVSRVVPLFSLHTYTPPYESHSSIEITLPSKLYLRYRFFEEITPFSPSISYSTYRPFQEVLITTTLFTKRDLASRYNFSLAISLSSQFISQLRLVSLSSKPG